MPGEKDENPKENHGLTGQFFPFGHTFFFRYPVFLTLLAMK